MSLKDFFNRPENVATRGGLQMENKIELVMPKTKRSVAQDRLTALDIMKMNRHQRRALGKLNKTKFLGKQDRIV